MRKKILFITDDIFLSSGVGNISLAIVKYLYSKYDFFIIGARNKSPNHRELIDFSEMFKNDLGIDGSIKQIIYNSYGDVQLFNELMEFENIDALLIMTDPRHHLTLFENINIFNKIPKFYYHVWDSDMTPFFNKPYLDSFDHILSISKDTFDGVDEIFKGKKSNVYIPHGVNKESFYPIDDVSTFKRNFRIDGYKYIIGFNSVNTQRKGIGELLLAYKRYCDYYGSEDVLLFLHTQMIGDNNSNLRELIKGIMKSDEYNILIVEDRWSVELLNEFYNAIDVLVLPSTAEGFGLTISEAIMSGTMVICNSTGGMKDQLKDDLNFGDWGIPLYNSNTQILYDKVVPYITNNIIDHKELSKALKIVNDISSKQRRERALIGRNWLINSKFEEKDMCKSIMKSIDEGVTNFSAPKNYTITKI